MTLASHWLVLSFHNAILLKTAHRVLLVAGRALTKTCLGGGLVRYWPAVAEGECVQRHAPGAPAQWKDSTLYLGSSAGWSGTTSSLRSSRYCWSPSLLYEGETRVDNIISWNPLISWITFFFFWLDKPAFIDYIFKRGLGDELQTISEQLDLPEVNIVFPMHMSKILSLLLNLLLFPSLYSSYQTNSHLFDSIRFFTNTQNWQYWHYCQLSITIYLQLPSLFATCDGSKYEIRYQWIWYNYISRLQTSLAWLLFNGTMKTKLAILAFLYCKEFVKNPNAPSELRI